MEIVVPKHWKVVPFTAIFDVIGGTQPSKDFFVFKYQPKYVRLLQIRDFGGNPEPTFVPLNTVSRFCTASDILIARYGASVGKILTGMEGAYNVAMAKLEIPTSVNRNYVYYYLKSDYFQTLISRFERSAQAGFNKADLFNIPFTLAPLKEQIEIAAKLDAFFDFLKERKTLLAKIETAIQYLRQSALQKAISGELTRRGQQNHDFQQTEWSINDINVFLGSGSTPNGGSSNYLSAGIPFIRSQNVLTSQLDLSDIVFISEKEHASMARSQVQPNDVLLNITGSSIGRSCVVPHHLTVANVNQHVCIIRTDVQKVLPDFLSIFFNAPQGQAIINTLQTGQTRQALNYSQIRSIKLIIYSIEEQAEIVRRVKTYFEAADNLLASCEKIKQEFENLQKSVLHQAFCGQLVEIQPNDEPIEVLLERIRAERALLETNRIETTKQRQKMNKNSEKPESLTLLEVLQSKSEPIEVEQLWRESKHKSNKLAFYRQLRAIKEQIIIEKTFSDDKPEGIVLISLK
jgi:type I restriction enzyme, S subunit